MSPMTKHFFHSFLMLSFLNSDGELSLFGFFAKLLATRVLMFYFYACILNLCIVESNQYSYSFFTTVSCATCFPLSAPLICEANNAQLVNNLFVPLYILLRLYLVQVGLLLPNAYIPFHVPPSFLTYTRIFAHGVPFVASALTSK